MRRLVLVAVLACSSPAFALEDGTHQGKVLLNCPLGAGAGTGDDNLNCSGGETLTFTRATPSIACPRTDLENTAVWEESANTPCYIDGCGLHMYQGHTNSIIRSEAFDNAAWTDVGAPSRSPGQADSPLNGADADTLADTLSGVDAEGVTQTYVTNATSLQNISVWAKQGDAPTAALFTLCVLTGTDTCNVGNGCCSGALTTTSAWQRFDYTATTGTTSQTKAMRIILSGDSNLHVWGAQAVTGVRTATANVPYCRSTGASATLCAADTLTTLVFEFPWVEGAVSMDVEPNWNALSDSHSTNQLAFFDARGAGNNNRRAIVFVVSDDRTYFTNVSSGGSITNISAALTWAADTTNALFAAWGAVQRSFGQNFTNAARDADGNAPSAAPTTVSFGSGISSDLEACVANVRLYRRAPGYMR